ncbi:MAG: phospholipase [Microbacteriaceae bacterium]|nr:MAG: phospholipase [Microbacteriaceae bacterium]
MPDSPALAIDPDAVRFSAPESERAGRPLLVLMHGYGSNEDDLISLAPHLPQSAVAASLRAPIAESGGYAWFSRAVFGGDGPSQQHADAAAQAVLAWLDTQPAAPSVGLLGFSQGGAMVLQLMRAAPGRFAFGVQLSGYVVAGETAGDTELATRRPPVFWGRGTNDTMIGPEAIARTTAWLPEHASADIRLYERLAHSISADELADVSAFIAAHL